VLHGPRGRHREVRFEAIIVRQTSDGLTQRLHALRAGGHLVLAAAVEELDRTPRRVSEGVRAWEDPF
jgi:hypothetical protein